MTEAEKFLIICMFCLALWLGSFALPPLHQIRRIKKRPNRYKFK